ncbi:MAG TPA: hypothetical protein VFV39_00330 [Limnobacter sp.]|nr:hypothetical protein [Limnobacter sp.]
MKQTEQVLVLAHGWGYNHQFFNPLLQALQNRGGLANTQVLALECGYFPDQAKPGLMIHTPEGWQHHPMETLHNLVLAHASVPWIGMGHSLGMARLLSTALRWSCLLSIHGFTRLAALTTGQAGVAPRVLARMVSKARSNLPQVLEEFHRACGHQPNWTTLNEAALLADLVWLQTLDLQGSLPDRLGTHSAHPTTLLAIYSPRDAIVPATLSQTCFLDAPKCTHLTVDASHGEMGVNPSRYTEALLPHLRSH